MKKRVSYLKPASYGLEYTSYFVGASEFFTVWACSDIRLHGQKAEY
jgi:hypothetical protein